MSGHQVTRVHVPPKKVIVITAPSGAGKTSIVRKLLTQLPNFAFSISCTTRDMRDGETNGKDYYFLKNDEFQRKVQAGEFAEHEEVYPGKFYGTLKSEVERNWNNRKIVLFDIDVKGAVNIKKLYGNDCLSIFIMPPTVETLEERLKNRMTENDKTLKERLKRSKEELGYADKFDKVVVNKDFDIAYMRVKNAINAYLGDY
jgi:guanylate kinase